MDKNTGQKQIKYEICDVCGKLTDVPVDMPIQERYGYIEGDGQLRRKCYYEFYFKQKKR